MYVRRYVACSFSFNLSGRMGHNPGSHVSDRGPLWRVETRFALGCTNAIGGARGDWRSNWIIQES